MFYYLFQKFYRKVLRRLQLSLYKNQGMKIGKNNFIHHTASLEIKLGGEIKLGDNNQIMNGCLLYTYGGKIILGNKCNINPYSILYGHGKGLVIGDNVLIAANTIFVPFNHRFEDSTKLINCQGEDSRGIIIENNVWIGAGCRILDGVTIGEGCVIGAGSVVTHSIPAYSIAIGVPARVIKSRIKN